MLGNLDNEVIFKKAFEIAKKLIKRNLTNDEIAEDIGLTVEKIE